MVNLSVNLKRLDFKSGQKVKMIITLIDLTYKDIDIDDISIYIVFLKYRYYVDFKKVIDPSLVFTTHNAA